MQYGNNVGHTRWFALSDFYPIFLKSHANIDRPDAMTKDIISIVARNLSLGMTLYALGDTE